MIRKENSNDNNDGSDARTESTTTTYKCKFLGRKPTNLLAKKIKSKISGDLRDELLAANELILQQKQQIQQLVLENKLSKSSEEREMTQQRRNQLKLIMDQRKQIRGLETKLKEKENRNTNVTVEVENFEDHHHQQQQGLQNGEELQKQQQQIHELQSKVEQLQNELKESEDVIKYWKIEAQQKLENDTKEYEDIIQDWRDESERWKDRFYEDQQQKQQQPDSIVGMNEDDVVVEDDGYSGVENKSNKEASEEKQQLLTLQIKVDQLEKESTEDKEMIQYWELEAERWKTRFNEVFAIDLTKSSSSLTTPTPPTAPTAMASPKQQQAFNNYTVYKKSLSPSNNEEMDKEIVISNSIAMDDKMEGGKMMVNDREASENNIHKDRGMNRKINSTPTRSLSTPPSPQRRPKPPLTPQRSRSPSFFGGLLFRGGKRDD